MGKSNTYNRMQQTHTRSNTSVMIGNLAHSNRPKPRRQQIIDLQQALRKTARQIDNMKAKLLYMSGEDKAKLKLKIWKRERVFNQQLFSLSMLAKQDEKSFKDTLKG
jgi:hypothetical protein